MKEQEVLDDFGFDEIISKLLEKRGLASSYSELRNFLHPSIDNLQDTNNIPNIDRIEAIISQHLEYQSQILVYGDYDVDGTSGATILYKMLEKLGADNVEGMISSRFKDGYGLSQRVVDYILEQGKDLVITVDCGISDWEYIKQLKEEGIDVIVIDHHEAEESIGTEFVDLKVESGDLEFTEYCGAGIAWMVARHLLKEEFYEVLDLVAFATVADVVPLRDDNRAIVAEGLKKFNSNPMEPLRELANVQNKKIGDITAGKIGYQIAPLINAQGRLSENQKGFEYLSGQLDVSSTARELRNINERRKEISKRALKSALKKTNEHDNIIIVQEDIPAGVVGLVAGDIKEKLNLPVIVIGEPDEDGNCKGSGRSVRPLNIYESLKTADTYLENFGGHKFACGLSIRQDNIDDFKEYMLDYTKDISYKKVQADMEIETDDINLSLINDLKVFNPTGRGNPTPKFEITGEIGSKELVGSRGEHLSASIDGIDAIGFGMSDKFHQLNCGIIGTLGINEWNGYKNLQVYIKRVL